MDNLFDITFDFWSMILIYGMIQGLFLIAIMLSARQRNTSVYLLSFLLFIIILNLYNYLILHSNFYVNSPHLVHLSSPLLLLLGPGYYYYIKSIFTRKLKLGVGHLMHLIPFILSVIFFTPFYVLTGSEKIKLLGIQLEQSPQPLGVDAAAFLIFQILISFVYIFSSIKLLQKLKKENIVRSVVTKYKWLLKFSYVFTAFWAIDFFATIWYISIGEIDREVYYITMLSCAFLVNIIALFAIKNNKVFSQIFLNNSKNKYETSKANDADLKELLHEINSLMNTDSLYLDSELSLQKLADELGKPKYLISQVLNVELGKSFYEFINEYRYNEVKKRLKDPDYENLTILAIALDSGFNNKNTFNKVFKRLAGVTPSQFLQMTSDVQSR